MKDDKVYLRHILDALDRIESYLEGVGKDEFLGEPGLVQDGVVRQLEIIGEAARGLSEEFKKSHPEVPCKEIVGMRNKIIHEYFSVDWLEVWNTSQKDVPTLKEKIQKLL